MRKLLSLVFAFLLVLSAITACSDENVNVESSGTADVSDISISDAVSSDNSSGFDESTDDESLSESSEIRSCSL